MKRHVIVVATAGLLLIGTAYAQQGQAPGMGPVGQSCADEIARLCQNQTHGQGGVRACLESNRASLSQQCRRALDSTGPGRGQGNRGG